MPVIGIVYKTTNNINKKIYIGQTTNPADKSYIGSGVVMMRAIKKYGKDNFTRETLIECSSLEELNEKERYYIKLFDSQNPKIGYNVDNGGNGQGTKSLLTRKKLSASLTGNAKLKVSRPHSAETKAKISKIVKERYKAHPEQWIGKHSMKQSTLAKILQTRSERGQIKPVLTKECEQCGIIFETKEDRRRFCSRECSDIASIKHHVRKCVVCGSDYEFSYSQVGVNHSEKFCSAQCRRKYLSDLVKLRKGDPKYSHSAETRAKISATGKGKIPVNRIKVVVFNELTRTQEEFSSMTAASDKIKIDLALISLICRNKHDQIYPYKIYKQGAIESASN